MVSVTLLVIGFLLLLADGFGLTMPTLKLASIGLACAVLAQLMGQLSL